MARYSNEDKYREDRKRMYRQSHMVSKTFSHYFPSINEVVISYSVGYGEYKKNGTITCKYDNDVALKIDCLNRECTSIYFDITNYVIEAIRTNNTNMIHLYCDGKESFEHLYHNGYTCRGELHFKVEVSYKNI